MTRLNNPIRFRDILKTIYCSIVYPFVRKRLDYCIMDSNETIDFIIKNHVSISRYGDGEYYIICDKKSGFQKNDDQLKCRLLEVLSKPINNHIVCLPYSFISLNKYRTNTQKNWRNFISIYSKVVRSTTPKTRIYGDSLFTRFYMILKDKSKALDQANRIKRIWEGKRVCIVEGRYTRFGVNNNLLDNCTVEKRILCPPVNAFSCYDTILSSIKKNVDKDTLVLCALGMTATVLSYDLAEIGYWAIDIGHLDIEYEWALMQANEKCPIAGKSVNEVGCNIPENPDFIFEDNVINLCH